MRLRSRRFAAAVTLMSLVIVAALVLSACGTPKPPKGPAGIVGKIETLQGDGNEWSMLVVGGAQAAGAVSDKAMCRITGDTTIVDAAGAKISPDKLAVGTTVAVWFTGAVAESYPVQGTAGYIEARQAAE